jgi:hypothetical protein
MTPRRRIRRIMRWKAAALCFDLEPFAFADILHWRTSPKRTTEAQTRRTKRLDLSDHLMGAELDWLFRYALEQEAFIHGEQARLTLMRNRIDQALDGLG